MIRWFERRQVYVPSRKLDTTAATLGRPFEDVWFKTSDGLRLNGWFFPGPGDFGGDSLVLLLSHGNTGNISHRIQFYRAWLELGVAVFTFDYRGFGLSEGHPTEEGTYLDAQAAHAWLCQRGFAPKNIIALGKSLGGGVSSELALREPLGALVLQNTFTNIPDIGAELFPFLPVRRWGRIQYDTRAKLPRVKVPVLVMHSRGDRYIHFRHGEQNFQAAQEPKMFWEIRGGHADTVEADRLIYLEGLKRFLATYFPKTVGKPATPSIL